MACFLVPAAEAVITTVAGRIIERRENIAGEHGEHHSEAVKHIGRLNRMLWGGCALLALEHIWHGEIVPVFPFLTGDPAEVLYEMATVGTAMAVAVTAVWGVLTAVSIARKNRRAETEAEG